MPVQLSSKMERLGKSPDPAPNPNCHDLDRPRCFPSREKQSWCGCSSMRRSEPCRILNDRMPATGFSQSFESNVLVAFGWRNALTAARLGDVLSFAEKGDH